MIWVLALTKMYDGSSTTLDFSAWKLKLISGILLKDNQKQEGRWNKEPEIERNIGIVASMMPNFLFDVP